jgi:hypothetical protein
MGEARRRALVIGNVWPGQPVAEAKLRQHRRTAALLLKAEVASQVALEVDRLPESLPEALPDTLAQTLYVTVAKVAGYRDRHARVRLEAAGPAQVAECTAHGCAINVHAPGCNLYTAQMGDPTDGLD